MQPIDAAARATALGISREAAEIFLASDVIDLHVDSFIWSRVFGYDLWARHRRGPFGRAFMGQVDLPRVREARITGAIWSVTTNPFRSAGGRARTFAANLDKLKSILQARPDEVALCKTAADYRSAVAAGKHGAFLGIQGGNALDADARALDAIADGSVVRVTLVHLTNAAIGATSAPLGRNGPLTSRGHDYVKRLNELRVFVDLAHISRRAFADAVAAHDKSQPLIVTHTGVCGVHDHWRNLTDDQLRAVADTGGTVGVIYQSSFLGDPLLGGRAETIVRHLEHIVNVAGEDCASLGSDWDGMIIPPADMPTCLELPVLVERMLARKWNPERIGKVLGGNFLRALTLLRGSAHA